MDNHLAYPWEGPPSFIRLKVGRSSAKGGTFAGNPWHRFAGRDSTGQAHTLCGRLINPEWGPTQRIQADTPRCPKCLHAANADGSHDEMPTRADCPGCGNG